MKELVQKWLADCSALPGMIAGGVGEPGGGCICNSADQAGCPPEKMEEILRHFNDGKASSVGGDLSPRWLTWVFAQGKIRSVTRPDGWTLGLVVRADSNAAQKLDALSAEFLAFPPGN